jgi:hypothetical protein
MSIDGRLELGARLAPLCLNGYVAMRRAGGADPEAGGVIHVTPGAAKAARVRIRATAPDANVFAHIGIR